MKEIADEELPEGWITVPFNDVGKARMGPTILAKDLQETGLAVYSAGQANRPWGYTQRQVPEFKHGTVVVSARGSIGFPKIPSEEVFTSTQTTIAINPTAVTSSRYLQRFLQTVDWADLSSGAAIPMLTISMLGELVVPIAPLAEQKRIADKLEAVLGRVDACRARLDRVPDLLKRFRQSVLAAATSGQLTENWRSSKPTQKPWLDSVKKATVTLPADYKRLSKQSFKPTNIEHGAGEPPPTWSVHTVAELYDSNVLIDFADGNHGGLYPRKEEFGSEGALFLTATQMDDRWGVSLDQCPRLNWTKAKQLVKGWARNSDVLLSHNATVGRVGLIEGAKEDVLLGTSVTFYRFNQHFILPRYGRIVFSSRFFQDQLESSMEQTTRDQVPITKQVSLNFICAPLAEQAEIVRRVEALFALADRIEARLATAQRLVERLTPATLSKAFRGDLVPQDPNDEPASVLLERVRKGMPEPKAQRKKSS